MDTLRFDRWTRMISSSTSRRQTLLALTLAGAALASDLATGEAKRGRNKRRRKKRSQFSPRTCADQCPESSSGCFNRPFGSPLCGDGLNAKGCVQCSSDQECLESAFPYCITSLTFRDSNKTLPIFSCPAYPVGVCASIDD